MPDYSIHVSVPLVEVPVLVTTKDGQFIPDLKQDNFRVYEDGVQQKISELWHHRSAHHRRVAGGVRGHQLLAS